MNKEDRLRPEDAQDLGATGLGAGLQLGLVYQAE
jgi:hypothetical protein